MHTPGVAWFIWPRAGPGPSSPVPKGVQCPYPEALQLACGTGL